MSQLFTSGGQSIGVSASTSVLPMNTKDLSLYYFVYAYLELLYLSDELILDHLGNVLFVVMCLALKFFVCITIATGFPGSSVVK